MPRDPPVTNATLSFNETIVSALSRQPCRPTHYNSPPMRKVAIIGAGELGGSLAHVLARRERAQSICLIDDNGRLAEGKALDISQSASVEGFSTELSASSDVTAAAGASLIVVADRAGGTEWQGEDGLMLLRRVIPVTAGSPIVCAGAAQRELVERAVRELRMPRASVLGSAPEAIVAGARALVALEVDASPADVALSIVGVPPGQMVVGWEDATLAGMALTGLLDAHAIRRLNARIMALWPPGPYALATAAAKVLETLLGRSRRLATCFIGPDDSAGRRTRAAALPVRLSAEGIAEVMLPTLGVAERVALDNAMRL